MVNDGDETRQEIRPEQGYSSESTLTYPSEVIYEYSLRARGGGRRENFELIHRCTLYIGRLFNLWSCGSWNAVDDMRQIL